MKDAYAEALGAICRPVRADAFPRSLLPAERLLGALGWWHRSFPCVLVAGSVGKGTAALRTARWLEAAGLSVGLYTGPHLHSFRERFSINGQMISCADFVRTWGQVRRAANQTGVELSTFELATALGLSWFAQSGVTVAVLEAGMGGRWDATNAAGAAYSLFTPIESEHVIMLGGSLQTIAYHKAGIIQPGGRAVSVRQDEMVADVLIREAQHKGARLEWAEYQALPEVVGGWLLDDGLAGHAPIDRSWAQALLPGRLEWVHVEGHTVLIDGGHTRLAGHRLRSLLDEWSSLERMVLVIGMLKDKPVSDYLSAFDDARFHLILTQAPGHRGMSAHDLLRAGNLRAAATEIEPEPGTALKRALDAGGGLVVVGGSLRMAALAREALGLLSAEEVKEARLTRALFEGEGYLARLAIGG